MNRFGTYSSPEAAQLILSCDAQQVLYNFHALRYPQFHEGLATIEGFTHPELEMVSRSLDAKAKARVIMIYFRPVAKFIAEMEGGEPAVAVIDYCQQQMLPMDYEMLHDELDQPLTAASILPNTDTLDDMITIALQRNSSRCKSLEAYILETTQLSLYSSVLRDDA